MSFTFNICVRQLLIRRTVLHTNSTIDSVYKVQFSTVFTASESCENMWIRNTTLAIGCAENLISQCIRFLAVKEYLLRVTIRAYTISTLNVRDLQISNRKEEKSNSNEAQSENHTENLKEKYATFVMLPSSNHPSNSANKQETPTNEQPRIKHNIPILT